MELVELLRQHSEEFGIGVSAGAVSALEAKLDIKFPNDFKSYLTQCNYAELYGDPIYGINREMTQLDLYHNNKHEEHFRYGFLEVFANDIDGAVYIRPDNGAVYNACFSRPIASSFTEFVRAILANDS